MNEAFKICSSDKDQQYLYFHTFLSIRRTRAKATAPLKPPYIMTN